MRVCLAVYFYGMWFVRKCQRCFEGRSASDSKSMLDLGRVDDDNYMGSAYADL